MKITKEELAARLNGREIMDEISEAECKEAKASGLVIVFGASDDLVELRGAIHNEIGAYNGTEFKIYAGGLLTSWDDVDHDDESEMEKYFAVKNSASKTIEALWCKEEGYSWTYKTSIPHSTFEIMEDGEHYCRGIVFDIASLK